MIGKSKIANSAKTSATAQPRRGITFAEGNPDVIGYRDSSDDEDEEEHFVELSLKSSGNADSAEKSPVDTDFDDENDPDRIKLRQLTESNTLFNSNYANFKLNDSGTGLGRSKPSSDSGPIKFVIQDGYKQPLAPTKFNGKNSGAAAMVKKLFENNNNNNSNASNNCDNKKQPVTPSNNVTVAKSNTESSVSAKLEKKSEPKSEPVKPAITKPSKPTELSSIPTIRIPRATIQTDKNNRSPPPASANTPSPFEKKSNVTKPTILEKPALNEKPQILAKKPEKPVKPIKTEPIAPIEQINDKNSPNAEQRNSVILHVDSSEGSIMTLDSRKLPIELKDEDVLDDERLYMITNKVNANKKKAEKDQDTLSDSGSDSGASGCTPLDHAHSPPSTSPTQQLIDSTPNSSCSASPSPDSLDSSPDSYDPVKSSTEESDESNRPSPVPPPSHPPPPPPPPSAPVSETTSLSSANSSSLFRRDIFKTPIISPKISSSDFNHSPKYSSSDLSAKLSVEPSKKSSESVIKSPPEPLNQFAPSSNNVDIVVADSAGDHSPLEFKLIKLHDELNNKSTIEQPKLSSHAELVKSNSSQGISTDQSAQSAAQQPNPNNKTMISISYRRSSSQQLYQSDSISSSDSGSKRNKMLARLAMDLEQHRSESLSNLSSNGSIRSSSASLSSNSTSNNAVSTIPAPSGPTFRSDMSQQSINQFLQDCTEEDGDAFIKSKSKKSKLFGKGRNDDSDQSTDSSDDDSDCEPLPDMIKSDVDEMASDDSDLSDSDMEHPHAHQRRASKESESKSSTSSIGKGQQKDKSVSSLFKNVVNSSNTKKYTKLMKKNLSKTSKFIVNTTKQLGNDTSDMVKKLKAGEKTRNGDFYYPDEYSEQKNKSKWAFSPNQVDETNHEGVGMTKEDKKRKKSFEVYSLAGFKNAFKNIEGKMKSSKSSSQADSIPNDPFGGSAQPSSPDGPALLKIKRLDSTIEPNYSEPNLLVKTSNQMLNTQSDSNILKPPLPPRNYRVAPPLPPNMDQPSAVINNTNGHPTGKPPPPPLPELPPQAPLRRKKLAKKRDQLISEPTKPELEVDSSIELSLEPYQPEIKVAQAPKHKPKALVQPTLSHLQVDYENYLNVLSDSDLTSSDSVVDSITVLEDVDNADNCKLYKMLRCKRKDDSDAEDFYLLSSKIVWTTCFDQEVYSVPQFKGDPCRLVPRKWSRFVDIASFCKQYLNNPQQQPIFSSAEQRASLVDSLVLQLHTILARFEFGATGKSPFKTRPRTVGDVNEAMVGFATDDDAKIVDVLLLLPTKELTQENPDEEEDGDSLSMMQSFCLQVFLIRLTSMITNEDNEISGALRRMNSVKQHSHYRNLVRRNQNGFSSLRDLHFLCSVDIFRMLAHRRNMTNEQIEQQIRKWFAEERSSDRLTNFYEMNEFKSSSIVLNYLRTVFALNQANQSTTIELVQKELNERA